MSSPIEANTDRILEQAVLGQMLSFGVWDAFSDAGLEEDDFFQPEHRDIWKAICAVQETGGKADIVTVGQRLRADGFLDGAMLSYYSKLVHDVVRPGPENVVLEVAELRQLSL